MDPEDDVQKSPDGRFEIRMEIPSGDHYMAPDREWKLIDTTSGRTVESFYGSTNVLRIKRVAFDESGRFLIARNGYGKILSKIDLADFAAKEDARESP